MEDKVRDHVKLGWGKHKKKILVTTGSTAIVILLLAGGLFAYAQAYDGRIYPSIQIGGVDVGGLSQEEAFQVIDQHVNMMLDEKLNVTAEDLSASFELRASGADDPDLISDLVYVNVDAAVENAYALGRSSGWFANAFSSAFHGLSGTEVDVEVALAEDQLEALLQEAFGELENPGEPTHYLSSPQGHSYSIEVVEGTTGQILDMDALLSEIEDEAKNFSLSAFDLALVEQTVEVSEDEARTLAHEVADILIYSPYTLTHTAQSYREYDWSVDDESLTLWLLPAWDDDELVLTLAGDDFESFVDELHDTIDVEPVDARFSIEGDRVTEFAGSQNGLELDEEATFALLLSAWEDAPTGSIDEPREEISITVVTQETEPEITTGSVNNLGINEILGVGISDFSGSPANRVANIQHGAAKLNGILLAPGETLSLIDELGPFTVADGYLPELVIKGDEIKPEVGGGLCQIGTTTFRATMNAGLEVTERRNHSLVVSYYDDPINGNPGTDATIYDPAPDYKMTNDTENYVLLTTEVDLYNYELIFTFWGTSDGREGYYTAPQILSWSGYGETQYIETLDLPPGVEECQSPHSGASTSFTYYVDYGDGTQHEKTYTSVYRSLPWICLVGVESLSCEEGDEECEAAKAAETEEGEESEGDESEETTEEEPAEETAEEPTEEETE